MNDPYIIAARIFQVLAVLLGAAGIGGLVWLIADCWKVQRQANANDRRLEEISSSLRTRAHFTARCTINPTFPKTHKPETR